MAYRINPQQITGTITAIGIANAIGPYQLRGGKYMSTIRVSGVSTNTTDVCQIFITEPGATPNANNVESPKIGNLTALTCPFSVTLDEHQIGGACDVYVYATTATGTISVKVERAKG